MTKEDRKDYMAAYRSRPEYKTQRKPYDRKYKASGRAQKCQERYAKTPQGMATMKRYQQTAKYKAVQKRYYLANRDRILAKKREQYHLNKGGYVDGRGRWIAGLGDK